MSRGYLSRIVSSAALFACSCSAQEQVLAEAARLDSLHRCGDAEQLYRKARATGTESAVLLNNLGNHYLICGSPDDARAAFQRLLKIRPAHVNANLQLARLALARKDSEGALRFLARIETRADPEVALVSADALDRSGQREKARAALDLVSGTEDPAILFAAGVLYGRMGLYDRAEASFSSALARVPGDFDLLFNLGVAAARAGHPDRALRALEAALQARPGDADALYELGRVESARRNFTHAVYLLAQARKLAPGRADVTLALARASQMAGFYGDSILAYDDYLKLRPAGDASDDIVRRDRALVLGFARSGFTDGMTELGEYLKRHPDDPIGHYDLAQLEEREDHEKALAEVSLAVRLKPDFEPARFFRAWLLQKLGRDRDSLAELEAAMRVDPADARAYDLAGLDYLNLEKPADAERVLRIALRLAPDEPEVLFHLSRALMELDRAAEAKPFLARFEELRAQGSRASHEDAGMIEAATLAPSEQRKRAIEQLQNAVLYNPGDAVVRAGLAEALLADGRVADAMAAYRELFAMRLSAEADRQAGATLLRYEQYALARDFLRRAAAHNSEARLDLAIALFYSTGPANGPDDALRVLDEAEKSGTDPGDCLLLRAKILDATGRSDDAVQAIEASLPYAVRRPSLAVDAALILVRRDNGPRALELLDKALQTVPENADLMLARGIALAALGRNSDAALAMRHLERRWPEWDRVYLAEGLVLERELKIEDAKKRIGIAISLGTRDRAASCALARMSGKADSRDCACPAGLFETFFPACAKPRS